VVVINDTERYAQVTGIVVNLESYLHMQILQVLYLVVQ
jgi:hypothetical protein